MKTYKYRGGRLTILGDEVTSADTTIIQRTVHRHVYNCNWLYVMCIRLPLQFTVKHVPKYQGLTSPSAPCNPFWFSPFADVLPGRCTAIIETVDQYSGGDFKIPKIKITEQ